MQAVMSTDDLTEIQPDTSWSATPARHAAGLAEQTLDLATTADD